MAITRTTGRQFRFGCTDSTPTTARSTAATFSVGNHAGTALPNSAFMRLEDPNQYLGASRTEGKLIVDGHLYVPGATSNTNGYGTESWSGPGNTEIHSFDPGDGNTLRFGVRTEDGINAFRLRTVFDNASNGTYMVQSGVVNTTVASPPSDQLYVDGTRIQTDYSEGTPGNAGDPFVKSGPGADTIALISTVKYGDFLDSTDIFATLFNLHAPNAAGGASSGMSVIGGQNQLRFVYRYLANWTPATNGSRVSGDLGILPSSDLKNKWVSFVMTMKQSPNLADGPFSRLWYCIEGGTWIQLFDYNGRIGYTFPDAGTNDENFVAGLSYYQFHNGNPTDPTYEVRDMHYGGFGYIKNPTQTVAQLQAHAETWMP